MAALASGCKMLRSLNLSYCSNITDKGMEHISRLRELYNLEIRGLVNVTNAGLAAVAASCNNLAELDIKHCVTIDNLGFQALAYYSRNLRQVCLFRHLLLIIHCQFMMYFKIIPWLTLYYALTF